MFMMKKCFLLCVSGLTIACIICCRVNVTLDMILGIEHILISWFVIILALLGVVLLFICCMIHCEHLRYSEANKLTHLLTHTTKSTIDIRALASTPPGMPGTHLAQYFGWEDVNRNIPPMLLLTFGYSRPILVVLAQ